MAWCNGVLMRASHSFTAHTGELSRGGPGVLPGPQGDRAFEGALLHLECGIRKRNTHGQDGSDESESELQGAEPIGYACVKQSRLSKKTCKSSA
eukprot:352884-Chlamydomonas_euryale.AAC.6